VVDRRHEPHVGRLEGIPEGERHSVCGVSQVSDNLAMHKEGAAVGSYQV
jgi:hypothetical protein